MGEDEGFLRFFRHVWSFIVGFCSSRYLAKSFFLSMMLDFWKCHQENFLLAENIFNRSKTKLDEDLASETDPEEISILLDV